MPRILTVLKITQNYCTRISYTEEMVLTLFHSWKARNTTVLWKFLSLPFSGMDNPLEYSSSQLSYWYPYCWKLFYIRLQLPDSLLFSKEWNWKLFLAPCIKLLSICEKLKTIYFGTKSFLLRNTITEPYPNCHNMGVIKQLSWRMHRLLSYQLKWNIFSRELQLICRIWTSSNHTLFPTMHFYGYWCMVAPKIVAF